MDTNLLVEGAAEHLPTTLSADANELAHQLQIHQRKIFPPASQKTIRRFSPAEAAKLIGIKEGYLRQVAADGHGPEPNENGRRTYSVEDMDHIRQVLDEKNGTPKYVPIRRGDEKLQVITVMNFKGGSGKTTTSAHLAQFLALRGYRVLTIDLDPQASLSAMFGHQPELDVDEGETLYGAIRYEDPRALSEIIRSTYTPNLHIVPGNLELMEFEHETPKAMSEGRSASMFFARIGEVLTSVESYYDVVVIDCPPQLGFLTMSALSAATGVLITVHPQMLDVMSMSQFLSMTAELMSVVEKAGGRTSYDWMRYLVTRFEPNDGPQSQMTGFMRSIFGNRMLQHAMLKSTAISDAGVTKQTLYEVERSQFVRGTYDRAMESMSLVNQEIEDLLNVTWGRR
ncbi:MULTISPECIES: plasmid partitioning protein RepA [Stappiaceae]|jgi:chromosome partitioning protein|uniref:plasmid partitioning protein RepA n=1 Tax=Stappiaceae TaxID=2821832 RepID=UPI000B528EB0|nr:MULTISPECIES: plasmid partitioning protein RepA [Stappiaceae]MBO9463446.1 plasmid partitioning protein RepA [Labrenzia sp. R5_0]QFT01917.1 Sporulation initiation inhibitor protein Soj [Labrenzia sp. THAF191b]QFT07674.1 Sporulation initiation inhibitor protein Soj [Labrenzia sp. THAF191a]QFT19773.1 Sporulation initiation inhibitor protein Soj [Labrenzia sp. THAF187b]QFT71325.1 Sporulation initiation inhibitor protein Soj [Labrenzia sp. THAF35]